MTTARKGLLDMIIRWRSLVNDTAGSVWADWEVQTIMDDYRVDLFRRELDWRPANISGTLQYRTALVGRGNLETVASGTTIWQVWDANGSAIGTASYSVDYQRGILTFTADQKGSARFLDARSYDLFGAAAHGWRELAASKASLYRFTADGATYNREQWFEHCQAMQAHYQSMATSGPASFSTGRLVRVDVAG